VLDFGLGQRRSLSIALTGQEVRAVNLSRWKDFGAMLMIGDGMMGLVQPCRYTNEWKMGPKSWQSLMKFLNEHPNLTRVLGAVEVAGGLILAMSETDNMAENQIGGNGLNSLD
jgi:hypothetical protein